MGSEESVGSVELKKILDSFEAGEVLPEVNILSTSGPIFLMQNGVFYIMKHLQHLTRMGDLFVS